MQSTYKLRFFNIFVDMKFVLKFQIGLNKVTDISPGKFSTGPFCYGWLGFLGVRHCYFFAKLFVMTKLFVHAVNDAKLALRNLHKVFKKISRTKQATNILESSM